MLEPRPCDRRVDLVDKDGPEKGLSCGPGEFVWRPAGSRHSAWTPEGGLMIAIFQILAGSAERR